MTQVKICGLTRLEDARVAAQSGADYLGFIFYQKSPRYVTPEKVADILKHLPRPRPLVVGVFVNASEEEIEQIVSASGVDMVQLHGDEEPGFVEQFPKDRVVKALRVHCLEDCLSWISLPALLLDAAVPGVYGGSGIKVDWAFAALLKKSYNGRLFLAGGLTPDNVEKAIAEVNPDVVDVSSGVEDRPGVKNKDKILALMNRVKRSGL